MKEISAFDVIGPVMIGPSSSHTAGALRIALLARKMFKPEIAGARFVLYGSFAETCRGHGIDLALAAGILGFEADDPRIPESFSYARKAGVGLEFSLDTETKNLHPNTADIYLRGKGKEKMMIRGVSVGGGRAEIRGIDGVDIKLSGDYNTVFIEHRDAPGIAAFITNKLSEKRINIAFMRLYREAKGKNAYTIIEADEEIPESVVSVIEEHEFITCALLIRQM
jgi:L-serine dehydratase